MANAAIFLVAIIAIAIFSLLMNIHAENAEQKERHERHVENIKHKIKSELESIKTQCGWPSEETLNSLINYHEKMLLMESDPDITSNLKPYDEYYKGKLRNKSALNDTYSIVIDKQLTPRFLPDVYLSSNNWERDIELSACPNAKELENFIDECKKIIMDKKIDKFRKKQIEEKLK